MTKNKGFTLIEMMVVVAIIAILSGSFLIGLRGFRSSAYDARRLSDLQKMQGSLELYYNKYGYYPAETSEWGALEGALYTVGVTKLPNDPQYNPNDPSAFENYAYGSNGQEYVLRATLSDVENKALRDDIDNDSLPKGISIDCDGSHYCITP